MRILVLLVALAAVSPAAVIADAPAAYPLSFRIADEAGNPVANAVVTVGSHAVEANTSGSVSLVASDRHPLTLEVRAPGFYPSVQTLLPGGGAVADIRLVRQKSGRRLLLFAGDAMLSRRYFEPRAGERILIRDEHIVADGRRVLQYVKPYIEVADFASVNLESVVSGRDLDDPLPKSVTFQSPRELPGILQWAGFDYAALGNNHTYDFRDPGIVTTLAALEQTALGYSGAGLDEAAARAPYRVALDGAAFGWLSYVGWAGSFEPTQSAAGDKGGAAFGDAAVFQDDIAAIEESDVVVLQQHAGIEYAERASVTERSDYRGAIEAGADVVIGHHPHVLQGIEIHDRRLIAYSMGNFLFDQYIYATQGGMLLYVWLDGERLHRAEVVPLNINGYVPTPATGAFRHWVLNRIARLSREFGSCFASSGQHAVITPGTECKVTSLAAGTTAEPIALRQAGVAATDAVAVDDGPVRYRVGVDLLPRGDFESSGLFGTPPRAWITGEQGEIRAGDDNQYLALDVPPGKTVRSGMKVFERAFQLSTPATVSGRLESSQPVTLTVYLQRRRIDESLADALDSGALTKLGALSIPAGNPQTFRFEHALPRLTTRSIRLLIDVAAADDNAGPADVRIDDLAWVEWRTPWLRPGDPGEFGTHIQFRP